MPISLPKGFRFSGVYTGVKRNPNKLDLSLVVSDVPAVAAGVYTQNLVFAAPVALDRERTPSESIRVVVANSGNANACTGERGLSDAKKMAELAASAVGAKGEEALVLSTGIIGEFLPLEKIAAGIPAAAAALGAEESSLVDAARGLLTTDTVHKIAGRSVETSQGMVQIVGMAKGAAMIGPRMATMLGLIASDARLDAKTAQSLLTEATDDTFNCISVDGHMSTNDTVLLLANGAANQKPLAGADLEAFRAALHDLCGELARSIPADGEGATHLITIDVTGCPSTVDARRIAKTVAESPLVKTAVAGADPNWGRVVSAVGYSGVSFDPQGLRLTINGHLLYENGAPVAFEAKEVSRAIADNRDTAILLELSAGSAKARFWTTDLTAEYVRLNADYHT